MKDAFKSTVAKTIAKLLIFALLLGAGYGAVKHYMNKQLDLIKHEQDVNILEVLEERLEAAAELNTAEYICTHTQEYKDRKKINDWNIPFTVKKFTMSYEGTVKAGISDLTKTKIEKRGDDIVVKLPAVEITGHELNKDSLQIYDESHNILNQISVEDVNEAQKNLEEEMVERAKEYGLLEKAKTNAESIVGAMLKSTANEYTIVIEWQE